MAIADLPHAILSEISPNEVGLDQKSKAESQDETEPRPLSSEQPSMDDPVGLGFGAWARPVDRQTGVARLKYYIGKFRFDALRWINNRKHRTEVGFAKVAVDELFDGDGRPMPLVAIYLTENDVDSFDQAEQPVVIVTRRGMRVLVPIHAEGGIVGAVPVAGGLPTAFRSDNGQYHFQVQGDEGGKLVQYDRHGSENPVDWTAVAQWTGTPIAQGTKPETL